MSLAINFSAPETPVVDPGAAARGKRDLDAANVSGSNAFAATLANAMLPAAPLLLNPPNADASSELDASATGVGASSTNEAGPLVSGSAAQPDASSALAPAAPALSTAGSATLAPPNGGVSSDRVASASGAGGLAKDEKPAFAAAAEARAAAADTPVQSANSGTDALNPDFRARLGRVITRMHDEFGKDVQLVEGFRTQSRQNFLYDQGRTRPGEVVTWTKASKHTLGLAADVTIDGSYTDMAGFQQLAQVAAQEGLRTLGARDPGHLELPTHGGVAAWGTPTPAVNIDDNVSRAIGIALDQSSVAGKSVDDSESLSNLNGLLSRVGRGSGVSSPQVQMPTMSAGSGGSSGSSFQRNGSDSRKDALKSADSAQVASVASVATVAQVASVAQVAHLAGAGSVQQPSSGSVASPTVITGTGSAAADKVGKLLDARDANPAPPMSQVTLNIDNAAGGADKITVQLRGGAVDTAISLGDTNRADRMSLRVGELQHALEQHGLDATTISVASTGNSTGPGWNPRQGSDQTAQDGRSSLNYRDNRQDADGTRQRSRREQQGGRQK